VGQKNYNSGNLQSGLVPIYFVDLKEIKLYKPEQTLNLGQPERVLEKVHQLYGWFNPLRNKKCHAICSKSGIFFSSSFL